MPIAIVREPSASLGRCELSFVERAQIDPARARAQHCEYTQALRELGCEVVSLAAEDALPDAVFVEDVALVFDELAVMTRPGAESRRAEGATVAAVLRQWRRLETIDAPGTIDGGDVLRVGQSVYVGASARSNAAAVEQLRGLLGVHGYRVERVPMQDCLHLKSAVTEVAPGVLLINPDWANRSAFPEFTLIEVDPGEAHAANTLRIGEVLIYPACFPRTLARLRTAGIEVRTVDVSELQKAEGAVTCCSLIVA